MARTKIVKDKSKKDKVVDTDYLYGDWFDKSRKKGLTGPIRDAQEKDDPFISGRERKKERRRKSGSKSMKKEDKVETDSYIESGYPKDWVNTLKGSYAKGKKNYPYKKKKKK